MGHLDGVLKVGKLFYDSDVKKYRIKFEDGSISYMFSSGHWIEIYKDGKWYRGDVDYREDCGYYFSNTEIKQLELDGITARVWIYD